MKKVAGVFCRAGKGILLIGFSIQIILGLVWMCCNIIEGQKFGAPSGWLYPFLLRVVGDGVWILYLLQLGLAYYAARRFLAPLLPGGIFWRIWGSLALLTIPMALQCHMAALPYSAVSSLFLLELCSCRKMFQGGNLVRETAAGAACWLILWALLPEYGLFGAVPLVLTLLVQCGMRPGEGKRVVAGCQVVAAFGGILGGLQGLLPAPAGRKVTWEQALASRFAWPNLWNDSQAWPSDLAEAAGNCVWEASATPGQMEQILFPVIDEAAGEVAGEFYVKMAQIAWQKDKTRIMKEIVWDVLGYGAAPAILQLQLTARGYDSYSGRNYEIMFLHTPVLAKYYVAYACWWFVAALGVGLLAGVAGCLEGRLGPGRGKLYFAGVCVVSAGGMILAYTMRGAGMMDYKCTVSILELWMAWVLSGMGVSDGGREDLGASCCSTGRSHEK